MFFVEIGNSLIEVSSALVKSIKPFVGCEIRLRHAIIRLELWVE
jgi:hypothetical protein